VFQGGEERLGGGVVQRWEEIDAFYATTETLAPEDVADSVACMISRPRHASIAELWIMPTDQV